MVSSNSKSVQQKDFVELLELLSPDIKIPKKDALRTALIKEFKAARTNLIAELHKSRTKVNFTTDMWTSPSQVPVMTITAHLISEDFQRINIILDFFVFSGRHSGKIHLSTYH